MTTAIELVAKRVVRGLADERLADVAGRIKESLAHHCLVFAGDEAQSFMGIIRLAEIAGLSDPGNRILADLVSPLAPCTVQANDSAESVADVFGKHHLSEAVVVDEDQGFRGLITVESVLEWSRTEYRNMADRLREEAAALRTAQSRMQAALMARDNFLATLSHELRTPLNPVLLIASERSASPELSAEVRHDFQVIAENTVTEARLVDDLLDLTRVVSGKVALDDDLVSVHAGLEKALAKVQPQLEEKKLILERDWTDPPPLIRGDALRLQQVFWNILQNAAKFTAGGGKIRVETRIDRSAGRVSITFRDTGIGMSATELAHVFEPFEQGAHSRPGQARLHDGLGLGLAIAKRLVELQSGTIEAASPGRDQGSTFVVSFPWPYVNGQCRDSAPAVPVRSLRDGASELILIVEDHTPTGTALAAFLQRRNFRTITVHSVADALALAERHRPSLIISDIGLPDGSGYDLMVEIRRRFSIPAIALSGYGSERDVERSAASGFSYHLTKPIDARELETTIAAVLAQS